MTAAARTVDPDKQVHSLHAYFLRGGDETKPLHFRLHRDFDGRSFSNRRVVVRQDGKVIFNLTASFQRPAEGLSHQVAMPDLLPPEERSEEHTSELQSLMRNSYAVFCLKNKKNQPRSNK